MMVLTITRNKKTGQMEGLRHVGGGGGGGGLDDGQMPQIYII